MVHDGFNASIGLIDIQTRRLPDRRLFRPRFNASIGLIDIQTGRAAAERGAESKFQCLNRLDRHSNSRWARTTIKLTRFNASIGLIDIQTPTRVRIHALKVCFNASIGLIDIQTYTCCIDRRWISGFNASIGLIDIQTKAGMLLEVSPSWFQCLNRLDRHSNSPFG